MSPPSLERHLQLVPESQPRRRRVGVVRVSRLGEDAKSPGEQKARLLDNAERDGAEMVAIYEELSVSGRTPLHKRLGLTAAIEMVEREEADEIAVAYFDRLVRSVRIQQEMVERVQAAGGKVLALDIGEVTDDTAARWMSVALLAVINEGQTRMTAERTADSKANAVARGVPPFGRIPPGYRRRADDGTIAVQRAEAKVILEAFRLRAKGESVETVRRYLRDHGIVRNRKAVANILANRFYLGELRFGKLQNLSSHKAIVDEATFRTAQSTQAPRGRRALSENLLARQKILLCGLCKAPMAISHTVVDGKRHAFYRCQTDDCPHVTVSARIAEA